MRFASSTIALVIAASATGCIHGWAPTAIPAGSTEGLDAEPLEYSVSEPVRVSRAGRALGVFVPGDRLRVSGDEILLLPREGSELALSGSDVSFEVSRVDHGLTALHTIVWSLSATASAIGSFLVYVFVGVATGDAAR